jgi:hypothetical protein
MIDLNSPVQVTAERRTDTPEEERSKPVKTNVGSEPNNWYPYGH